ncbi:transposon Ty3-I Gag-Pol polyprotein [Trichonephila clavipes]|nr:transposon Ty3-I Gag-Pol polyprotein [Trichonephila clavipes]
MTQQVVPRSLDSRLRIIQSPSGMTLNSCNPSEKKDPDLTGINPSNNCSPTDKKTYELVKGILCKKNFALEGKMWLPIIPKHLRAVILGHFRDKPTARHLGFAKTYDRIHQRLYLPEMYQNVVQYVMHCRECQRRNSVRQRPYGILIPLPPAIATIHQIWIDLIGRFSKSTRGKRNES